MEIVVTDGYTLTSGDLSWDAIAALGKLTVYDRTALDLISKRCKKASIVVTNKTPFDRSTINSLPDLKCICVLATGYNVIDTDAAKERGIIVCNVPGYGTASVAQHVFALLLELTNGVGKHNQSVKAGGWQQSPDWSYNLQPVMELSGKTMGIIGFGHIGQQVAQIAAAFGMSVIFYNPRPKTTAIGRQTSLDEVCRKSDVISLHCPLTPENQKMVNREFLQQMKPTAFLINTARGPLVDEDHLAIALEKKQIAGAALDVLTTEPPTDKQSPLINADNCIVTPHNAWMSLEARKRGMAITSQNIEQFIRGTPINRVA